MIAKEDLHDEAAECCANCGTAEVDEIKLKKCSCYLVRYCGVKCQKEHRPKHKRECKQRLAELRDEMLFRQPESSHLGDCPICCLPMPLDLNKSVVHSCCSKEAISMRDFKDRDTKSCPFCRKLPETTKAEGVERLLKRAEVNDPIALLEMCRMRYEEGDYDKAFEYCTRSAELGNAMAHYDLSCMYQEGRGVEKDGKRFLYHTEEAAIAGHLDARYNLGVLESENIRFDRAVKHWIIAANLGDDRSLQALKERYKFGLVSKDDLATALRAHQAAVDATESPQREVAEEYLRLRESA